MVVRSGKGCLNQGRLLQGTPARVRISRASSWQRCAPRAKRGNAAGSGVASRAAQTGQLGRVGLSFLQFASFSPALSSRLPGGSGLPRHWAPG